MSATIETHRTFLLCICQQDAELSRLQGRIGIYTPPKSVYLNFFMWLFCLIDPFIPTQIKFLATPLVGYCVMAQWAVLHEVRIVSVYREPLTTPVLICICQHLNRVLSVLVRLIGHIMRVARPSNCLSVTVRSSAPYGFWRGVKKHRKTKIVVNVVPLGRRKQCANFQFKRSNVKVTYVVWTSKTSI